MAPEPQTVAGRQGRWCDVEKHLIPPGGVYVNLPGGGTSCAEHKDQPIPIVRLAGAHE